MPPRATRPTLTSSSVAARVPVASHVELLLTWPRCWSCRHVASVYKHPLSWLDRTRCWAARRCGTPHWHVGRGAAVASLPSSSSCCGAVSVRRRESRSGSSGRSASEQESRSEQQSLNNPWIGFGVYVSAVTVCLSRLSSQRGSRRALVRLLVVRSLSSMRRQGASNRRSVDLSAGVTGMFKRADEQVTRFPPP